MATEVVVVLMVVTAAGAGGDGGQVVVVVVHGMTMMFGRVVCSVLDICVSLGC